MWGDLRFSARLLSKDRRFTSLAGIALALGIGASNTVFVIVNAVLLRELPVERPDRLADVGTHDARNREGGVSYLDYRDWQVARAFEGLAAHGDATMNLSEAGRSPERLLGTYVSGNAFRVLGVQPIVGRDFLPAEDSPAAAPVLLLSHRIWKSRYDADPGVVGRTVRINGLALTIVGIMPEGFGFPVDTDVWQPLAQKPGIAREPRDARALSAVGRLAEGVTLPQARAELAGIAIRLQSEYPQTNDRIDARVTLLKERYVPREAALLMQLLLAAVIFILLIACANVANLLLARAFSRSPEIAVRVALGATRWRIVRQLFIENVLLSGLAGVAGFALSLVGIRLFWASIAATDPPFWLQLRFDARVLAFLVGLSVITGMISGLVPALRVSKTDVQDVLKDGGGRGSSGGRSVRWTHAFVTVELALTLVLLCGAVLMVRSFLDLYRIDFGIRTAGLTVVRLELPPAKYATAEQRTAFYEQLGERLQHVSTFDALTLASGPPGGGGSRRALAVERQKEAPGIPPPMVTVVAIGDDYFLTLNVGMIRGRSFSRDDGTPGREHAIVDERTASTFFPSEDPIGRRIRLTKNPKDPASGQWVTIVGVAPSVRQGLFQDTAVVYIPYRAEPPLATTLLVRGPEDSGTIAAQILAELHSIDPDLPLFDVKSLDEFLAFFRWPQRVFGGVFAVLAGLALCLSAIGLGGVANYSVTQRTREIGIRMALGARAPQVLWLVIRHVLIALSIGVVMGLAGAAALSKLVPAFLVQTSAADLPVLIVVAFLLVAVAILACLWPVRRAVTLDPAMALRFW